MKYDNPAGRLHALLKEALSQKSNGTVKRVWAKVFEIDEDNRPLLLMRVSQVMNLFFETNELLNKLEEVDHELLLKRIPNIGAGLSLMNFENSWNSVAQHFDEHTMELLELCAFEISRAGYKASIPRDELQQLQHQIAELIEQIVQSEDIDNEFRVFLLKYLRMLENAIIDYRVSGVDGIVVSLERAVGALALRPDPISDIKTDAGAKFWSVLGKASTLCSLAVNTAKLLGYAIRPLGDILPLLGS